MRVHYDTTVDIFLKSHRIDVNYFILFGNEKTYRAYKESTASSDQPPDCVT